MEATEPRVFKKGGKQRFGRGFSRDELKKAGLSTKDALRLGMLVDPRRKTVHDENVEAIKIRVQKEKPAAEPKKRKGKPKS
jgi:large subunit ribosomal protein L13e